MSGKVTSVSDAEFDKEVLRAAKPVLVDFWAAWCMPCKMMAPVVEELAAEYDDRLTFVQMNVDENERTVTKYKVMTIPTIAVFRNGEIVERFAGYVPKEELKRRLDRVLA